MNVKTIMLVSCGVSALALGSPAWAVDAGASVAEDQTASSASQPVESSESQGLPEIIVTATKRADILMNVPVAISVVTGEAIEKLSITNLDELSRYTPSLNVVEGGEQTGVSIRGFSAGLNFGFDPTVGLFIDGVYAGRERQFRGAFLDIGRVEVLRGPQSTLFGKNTNAGAVLITTGQPVDRFEFSNRVEYSPRSDSASYQSVLNVPVSSNLAARFAVLYSDEKGFYRNTVTGGREEQEEDMVFRGTLLWEPTSNLTVRLKGEYSKYERIGRDFQISEISGIAVGRPLTHTTNPALSATPAVPFAQGEAPRQRAVPGNVGGASNLATYRLFDPNFDFQKNFINSKQRETAEVESRNVAFEVNWDLGPATLTSVTGYSAYDSNDQRDVDWSPTPFLFEPITQEFEQLSQELRITSQRNETFDYLVGLYAFKSDFFVDRRTDVDINLFFPNPLANNPLLKFANLRFLDQDADTLSVFAQGTWHVTPQFDITGGARWSRERRTAEDRLGFGEFGTTRFLDLNNPADAQRLVTARSLNAGLATQAHNNVGKRSERNWTPELRAAYRPNSDAMVYASVSTGRRSGGFNSSSTRPDAEDFEFGTEKVTGYEVGGKLSVFDRKAFLTIAAFRSDFKDLQTAVFVGDAFDVRNAGKARAQGVEFDAVVRPTQRLALNAAVLILESKFIENAGVSCSVPQVNFGEPGCFRRGNIFVQDLSGKRFGPRTNFTFGANYTYPIANDIELDMRADLAFRDTVRLANDPTVDQPKSVNIDIGANLQSPGGRWLVGALVQNLTDERKYFFEFEAPAQVGTRIGFLRPPRRVTFRTAYKF